MNKFFIISDFLSSEKLHIKTYQDLRNIEICSAIMKTTLGEINTDSILL